jgi:dipeptidyl aminopeptidase/acylaminoacyl peptidase
MVNMIKVTSRFAIPVAMLSLCCCLGEPAAVQTAQKPEPTPIPSQEGSGLLEDEFFDVSPFAVDDSYASPQQQQQTQRRGRGGGRFGGRVEGMYKSQVTPHWFADNTRFWYRNDLSGGAKEFILVDAEKGTRGPAFDHAKLAAALSKAVNQEFKADRLPFSEITFLDDGRAVKFQAADKSWKCDLKSYECSVATESPEPKASNASEGNTSPSATNNNDDEQPTTQGRRGRGSSSARSPDGKWTALVKEQNVYLRSEGGDEWPLSQDGKEGNAYGRLEWSPDSKAVIAWRIEPGERKEVYLIRSSPQGGGRAQFESRPYALPGDKFTKYELNVFDVTARKQIKPEVDRFEHEWEQPRLRWNQDGRRFAWQQEDRGHQRLRLIEADTQTGATRNIIDERTETFIWTAHTENLNVALINWLEKSDEIIYVSERDGWRHLYVIDAKAGKIKNQITKGEWVLRGIERIDEEKRQIWFRASGRNPDQDPYFVHCYRISFDGSGLVALTEGNGNHSVEFSPDRKYLIDTYSRVDAPPVNELRRTSDGKLVCKLEEADITELKASGWQPPEVFVAKGRDGKTDIWGIISRPRDLDPNKKYPVIEQIYAGPQGAYVPKSFSGIRRTNSLTELGFITVQMDGMGTAFRSKAFHDVCWKNLKDAGFPDRILWHQAVAKKYAYYDISRVGIYGNSAGGQNAAGAVLFHPEFYKAAVANSGCHDNRMDKASWNEQWMGYPVGPQYSECSNIDNAGKLQGHLFLVMGEMDTNVPIESTMRFVDALVRANKDFDLLVVPNGGHGAGGQYYQRRMADFFVRYLQGTEPPNRNASTSGG